jgi:hypothetical protein
VFTTRFKARVSAWNAWSFILVAASFPTIAALWAGRYSLQAHWGVYAAAIIAASIVWYFLRDFLAPLGYGEVRRQLAAALEREGLSPEILGGTFVGFGPHGESRYYEGHTIWDVGFLFLDAGSLVYVGDQTRFRLRREEIAGVRLGAGPPSWQSTPNLYVDWRDAQGEPRTFFFRGSGRATLTAIHRATRRLAERLDSWRRTGEDRELPPALQELPPPSLADVTGQTLREMVTLRKVLTLSWMVFLITLGLGALLDLGWAALRAGLAAVVLHWIEVLPYFFPFPRSQKA